MTDTETISAADDAVRTRCEFVEDEDELIEYCVIADQNGRQTALGQGFPCINARDSNHDHAEQVILFAGLFVRREDAIAIAHEIGSPMLLVSALTDEQTWPISDPNGYEQLRRRVQSMMPRRWLKDVVGGSYEAQAAPPF